MAARFFARRTRKEAVIAAQWEEPILKYRFDGHKNSVWCFVFLRDNVHIVSGSEDGTMRKWNCDTGLVVGEPWKGEGGSIYALALSPDGKMIACGREDGSVQCWNTKGKMIIGVRTGHSKAVLSLLWSPSGTRIASGSYDGTILIHKAGSGKVEVGPINTEQEGVESLAYSPSGDRIASGGYNSTICIWNTNTGKREVGPIGNLWSPVTSVVWSFDGTKLYSTSNKFARVLDSISGETLHQLEHNGLLYSVALSSNVLACVGDSGVSQLWNRKSLQPLGQPFAQEHHGLLFCVSFSQDEKYLAYGGDDGKLTLWMIKDVASQLAAPVLLQPSGRQSIQEETIHSPSSSSSSSSSCLGADATGGDCNIDDAHDDPYNNFFQSSRESLPSASPGSHIPNLFSPRRFLNVFPRHRPPAGEPVPQERSKRRSFARRTRSDSPLELATMKPHQPVPEVKVQDGEGEHGENVDDRGSANDPLNNRKDKGKKRYDPPADAQSPPSDDPNPPTELDSADNRNLWKWLMGARGKDSTNTIITPVTKRPEVVDVYAVRGFQRYVALTPQKKRGSLAVPYNIPLVVLHASGSSQPGPSSQTASVQAITSSQLVSGQPGSSSPAVVGHGVHYSQPIGGSPSHASPSHFVTTYHTNHDSDSRSSIEGSFNRFLDRICFPCGHFH